MTDAVRLGKRVAAQVPCSRREAELYIECGCVRVDGVVVEEPQERVGEHQRVEVDTSATVAALAPVTLLVHQSAGMSTQDAQQCLTPATRTADDHSGIRTVKRHFAHLVALLALPPAASGLAVFSQEPRVIRKLTEDAAALEQEVIAEVTGQLQPDGIARLCHGLVFEARPLPPIKVSWQNENRLRFALKGIAPQLVPWMCEQVGLHAVTLKRIRIGRVPLAGLPAGQWRYLQLQERF